jgi:hypothetical protein
MSPLPDVPTVTHIPAPAIGGQPAPQLLPGLSEPRQHHPASHTHVTPAPASARLRRAGTVTDDRDTNGKVRTLARQSDGKRAANEFSKNCLGLDQSQVRLYTAIARHTVLVMAALAACAVTAALLRDRTDTRTPPAVRPDQPLPADPGMVPLSIPEITRLLASPPTRLPGHAEHWSAWRRRHQGRADWYRQRTRLHRDPEISLAS